MAACPTDIDWSLKPEPWRQIGPRLRAECEWIAKSALPAPKPFDADAVADGAALRQRRLALGITQEGVARRAGIGTACVSEVERGVGSAAAARTIKQALDQLEERNKK